jgi:4-aminobutyrate aminotransferase/(S)-3-amino-2-methylpropionate transaminase
VRDRTTKEPYPELIPRVLQAGLEEGLILLPGGTSGNVLSVAPPFVITEEQVSYVELSLPRCLSH